MSVITSPSQEYELLPSTYLYVCLFVCLSARIYRKPHVQTSLNFAHITCRRGSVFLWRRCNTLCTSGFVYDVMFSHNGSYGQNQRWHYVWSSSPGGGTSRRPRRAYRGRNALFPIALFVLLQLWQTWTNFDHLADRTKNLCREKMLYFHTSLSLSFFLWFLRHADRSHRFWQPGCDF